MPRPRKIRHMRFNPNVYYFKPRGVPMRTLEEVIVAPDELEAIKLHHVDGLNQQSAAKKMKISQPTFARTINAAYKKIAEALTSGKAIRLEEKE